MSAALSGVFDVAGNHEAHWNVKAHAAATATEDLEGWRAPVACTVSAIYVTPAVAATGDTTNRTNFNFINRGTAGLGSTEVANLDFITGVDCVASAPKTVTVTAFTMAVGEVLTVQAEKVSSGVAIGACTISVVFQPK